ncbi:MAG: hypothetical protein KatS3mg121_0940 [Gammaproteobacteria bacterium]|nr:MAG: hypothetical protein KatS3mg121_0940 [Gammaproteobacteria bacterium]
MARTRPYSAPARTTSPRLRRPAWTSTVATGPRPLSRLDSRITPVAGPWSGALSSSSSACSSRLSSRSSTPCPVRADTGTNMTSPPQSSGINSYLLSACLTRSGSASGLSILLTATTIGTPAALACSIASTVCGITPSSAATTSTTMSVTRAPRARIAVNAAWPGVSRKVMHALGRLDVIGADVLGDAAGLGSRHLGAADVVEQRGLAVVDVAHDGHHRRPRHRLAVVLDVHREALLGRGRVHGDGLVTHFLHHQHRGVLVERLVDGRHHPHAHQGLDQLGRLDGHRLGELGDGDGFGHAHLAHDRRGGLLETVLAPQARAGRGAGLAAAAELGGDVQLLAAALAEAVVLVALGGLAAAALLFGLGRLALGRRRRRGLRGGGGGRGRLRLGLRLGRVAAALGRLCLGLAARLLGTLTLELLGLAALLGGDLPRFLFTLAALFGLALERLALGRQPRRILAAAALLTARGRGDDAAPLAHFDRDRLGRSAAHAGSASGGARQTDLADAAALQGHAPRLAAAVAAAQEFEQLQLLGVGDRVIRRAFLHTGVRELLQQALDGRTDGFRQLFDRYFRHGVPLGFVRGDLNRPPLSRFPDP